MATPSLTSIILSNVTVFGLAVGIGIAYAILYYYYNKLIKGEESNPFALAPTKEIIFTIIVMGSIIAVDHISAAFMSGLLGTTMEPGQHVRLTEAIADRMFNEIKSVLYWSYLGEFVFTFFASIHFSLKFDLKPAFLTRGPIGAFGKGASHIIGKFLSKIPGGNKFSKAIGGSADIGQIGLVLQPFAGAALLWDLMEKISMFLFLMVLGYFLFYSIITFIIPLSAVFLPLGLGLMFIPPMRKTGASIVALVLTMYFVFPVTTIYLDGVFRNINWYDANNLFSFLSPTLMGMLGSDPAADLSKPEHSSFLMRELGYTYLRPESEEISLAFNTSDTEILARYIQFEQTCVSTGECVNVKGERIDEETAEKGTYQNFKSPNVVAPWSSFLTKSGQFFGEVWLLQNAGSTIEEIATGVEAYSVEFGPLGWFIAAIAWMVRLLMNFSVMLFLLGLTIPLPEDSPLRAVLPPFLPFYFFKTTMIFAMYVAQYALIYATMLFFQISLAISGYRSIAITIGGEPALPGLEKVL